MEPSHLSPKASPPIILPPVLTPVVRAVVDVPLAGAPFKAWRGREGRKGRTLTRGSDLLSPRGAAIRTAAGAARQVSGQQLVGRGLAYHTPTPASAPPPTASSTASYSDSLCQRHTFTATSRVFQSVSRNKSQLGINLSWDIYSPVLNILDLPQLQARLMRRTDKRLSN